METINSEKRHFPLYLKERIATYLVGCPVRCSEKQMLKSPIKLQN